jgi:aminoglycoside 6'-N-acetyltransferase
VGLTTGYVEILGQRVILRPVIPADVPGLATIITTPEVARWWPAYDRARVEAEFLADEEDVVVLGIHLPPDDRLVGLIQWSEESDPEFRHAAIDLFLDPAVQGRGLGPDAMRAAARHLVTERGHHRLTTDPSVENERAIRAYEKVGFRHVGRLRRYQRYPDGSWRDGVLMELLAEELQDE